MITMSEYAVMVAAVGAVIFDMIRSVFNLITGNTVLFAFICVAIFGLSLTIAINLFQSMVNTAISSIDGKLIKMHEFDDFMKTVRKDAVEQFELNEIPEPEIVPDAPKRKDDVIEI